MATGALGEAVRRTLLGLYGPNAPTDGQLLERFVRQQDAAVFEALVQRHGSMVLRVCQRVLPNPADAEDAFQATFLVLLRKAETLGRHPSVGAWLHQVAYRIALKARRGAVRRLAREQATAGMRPSNAPAAESGWADLRPVLDEELSRLPEKYRAPLVLCYLEGKTNDEAARQLGWTRGAVAGKLAYARDLLRERLARRGVALSVGTAAGALTESAAPAAVHSAALRMLFPASLIAGGAASERVELLAKGAVDAMLWAKLRLAGIFLAAALVLGMATVKGTHRAGPSAVSGAAVDDFHVRWRFDNGPPKDIRLVSGNWQWDRRTRTMHVREDVSIVLPARIPRRPFVLSVKAAGLDPSRIEGMAPYWLDGRRVCARTGWEIRAWYAHNHCWRVYFAERWCVAMNTAADREAKVFGVLDCRRPYPGTNVGIRISNTRIEEIELRGIRPEEMPRPARQVAETIKALGVEPREGPEQLLP